MSAAFAWTDAEVRRALGLVAQQNGAPADFSGVITDSRKVGPDDLYVALVGERFDGHDFVAAAAAGGATGAVVSHSAAESEGVTPLPGGRHPRGPWPSRRPPEKDAVRSGSRDHGVKREDLDQRFHAGRAGIVLRRARHCRQPEQPGRAPDDHPLDTR